MGGTPIATRDIEVVRGDPDGTELAAVALALAALTGARGEPQAAVGRPAPWTMPPVPLPVSWQHRSQHRFSPRPDGHPPVVR
ncbi:acyl-CoA carboxylase epsilon subunit [Haloechinothrix sp. LS1_15]|uniref:acyl-CoA carboxylase epsilon subunit n=1 Tax=Haloechinothrix sp. LS1_15 TaxID=2652248 RepID=UPI00294462CB|nr:hypothetical protein [Haloechinothrix sp. LS1_15]